MTAVKMTLKEMVMPGRIVSFMFYRKGELWYTTDTGFPFPVPISDTGDADFFNEDKAILFMRYIRKQMAAIEEGKATMVAL